MICYTKLFLKTAAVMTLMACVNRQVQIRGDRCSQNIILVIHAHYFHYSSLFNNDRKLFKDTLKCYEDFIVGARHVGLTMVS